jgi:predicted dienelactone hydrolase
MRPLEILLSMVNGLSLLALAAPALRTLRWARHWPLLAPLIAVAQVLMEGVRWQLLPAYALSAALGLVCLLRQRQSGGPARPHRPKRFPRLGIGLGLLGLAVSLAVPVAAPVFRLPEPTGHYAIGTTTYHWVDTRRAEMFTADPADRREIMVQIWYPAEENRLAERAPYVSDARTLRSIATLMQLPSFAFAHFEYVETHAIPSAPVARAESAYPVLVFSHGRAGFRQHNTHQVEDLASRGYVVAAIDHTYAASGVVFPDGRFAAFDPRMFDLAHPVHPAFLDVAIPYLAQDVVFVLNQLAVVNDADPAGVLTDRLDLERTGIFGASLGGAVAAEACRTEPRLRACPHDGRLHAGRCRRVGATAARDVDQPRCSNHGRRRVAPDRHRRNTEHDARRIRNVARRRLHGPRARHVPC